MEVQERTAFYYAGIALAERVFAPDYYDGPWRVSYEAADRRRRSKVCRNHATANMWAKYLRKHFGHPFTSGIIITLSKV